MEKSDFQDYRMLAHEVKRLRAKLSSLEASIYSPAAQRYTLTPRGSSGGLTMDDVVAAHAALEAYYQQALARKTAQQLAVEKAIDSLADPTERLIMSYRYIDGHSWRKICQTMQAKGVSERQVYRLHGWALERLKSI